MCYISGLSKSHFHHNDHFVTAGTLYCSGDHFVTTGTLSYSVVMEGNHNNHFVITAVVDGNHNDHLSPLVPYTAVAKTTITILSS